MTIDKKDISVTVGVLIGIPREKLCEHQSEYIALMDELFADKDAMIIRYLSKIRTIFIKNFKKIDTEIRYNLLNIDRLPEYFDVDEVKQLISWDVDIILTNSGSEQYLQHVNGLIYKYIDNCKKFFDKFDWLNFDYIKSLFCVPKYLKAGVLKSEAEKFFANTACYPYAIYIYWKTPQQMGLILANDNKFINFLALINNDETLANQCRSLTTDATEETKGNIYEFIDNSTHCQLVVDCENSSVYKLYAVIKGLNQEEINKVEKIILIDDPNTSTAWKWLHKFTKIPTEIIEMPRLIYNKSLVDIKLSVEITKNHYLNNIDSFILCSSDSDYWGLMSSVPTAKFMVMYEKEKFSYSILEKLTEHHMPYCCIDDFCTGNATDLKRKVLIDKLEEFIEDGIIGQNARELTRQVYKETRILASEDEIETFYRKYVKDMRLRINDEGEFFIEIPDV